MLLQTPDSSAGQRGRPLIVVTEWRGREVRSCEPFDKREDGYDVGEA